MAHSHPGKIFHNTSHKSSQTCQPHFTCNKPNLCLPLRRPPTKQLNSTPEVLECKPNIQILARSALTDFFPALPFHRSNKNAHSSHPLFQGQTTRALPKTQHPPPTLQTAPDRQVQQPRLPRLFNNRDGQDKLETDVEL